MSAEALFTTWDIPWGVTAALVVTAIVYVRGWSQIRRTRPELFPAWRLIAFLGGLWRNFCRGGITARYIQRIAAVHAHGAAFCADVDCAAAGGPRGAGGSHAARSAATGDSECASPAVCNGPAASGWSISDAPRVAWIAMNAAYLGWHIPKAYEFALASEGWHNFEHACFLFTSLMFWWPVIAPWPYRQHGSRWLLLPYLLLADLVNTGLSAFLCFSGRLLYPSYGAIPRLFGLTALNDQIAAGAFMWVMGSTVFLIPAIVITMQLLSPRRARLRTQGMVAAHR